MPLVDAGGAISGGYRVPGAYRHALECKVWWILQPDLFIGGGDVGDDCGEYERAEEAAKIRTSAVVDQLAASGLPVRVSIGDLPRELPQIPLFRAEIGRPRPGYIVTANDEITASSGGWPKPARRMQDMLTALCANASDREAKT